MMGVRMPAPSYGRDTTVQHARRSSEAPPEPDLAGLAAKAAETGRQAQEHVTRVEALLEAAEAGAPLPEWLGDGRLIQLLHGLRQLGASQAMTGEQLKRLSLEQSFNDMVLGAAEGSGFRAGVTAAAAGKHRHRKDRRPGAGQLSLIPGGRWKAPAVSGAAAMAAFRHAATAKGAAITTTAAAAAAVVTIGTSGFSTLPLVTPAPAAAHAQAFAGISPVQALPVPSLTPSPLRPYVPKHAKSSADAVTGTLAPPLSVGVVSSPSPSSPSAAPQDPAYGTLNVGTITVAIGLSGSAEITFTAVGGALQWHASSSSADLSLSSSGGILGKGQSAVITVSVPHGTLAGAGSVTITAGGQQVVVPVTWVSLPGLGL